MRSRFAYISTMKTNLQTKSTMTGWTKIANSHYRHETQVEVRKCEQGWEVIGSANDGYLYMSMWAAMSAAAKTAAYFCR